MLWFMQFVFFFSSRRRHTRSLRDWSSDVCSSDLCLSALKDERVQASKVLNGAAKPAFTGDRKAFIEDVRRSEERRVGKSVDLGGRRIIKKKKKNVGYRATTVNIQESIDTNAALPK